MSCGYKLVVLIFIVTFRIVSGQTFNLSTFDNITNLGEERSHFGVINLNEIIDEAPQSPSINLTAPQYNLQPSFLSLLIGNQKNNGSQQEGDVGMQSSQLTAFLNQSSSNSFIPQIFSPPFSLQNQLFSRESVSDNSTNTTILQTNLLRNNQQQNNQTNSSEATIVPTSILSNNQSQNNQTDSQGSIINRLVITTLDSPQIVPSSRYGRTPQVQSQQVLEQTSQLLNYLPDSFRSLGSQFFSRRKLLKQYVGKLR
eukprot:TRINITY_DN767_c0_g1_i3.p2 TRINITY_DN767_c0_g1~~TRINITY_DN767_c0_g1_i3.p2  ORF type:complete len:255 (+),score=22.30 TRINITY_DN767_c0_g1_i3:133-897(+)